MPPLQVTCSRCIELWREYADATRHHVELLKAQERSGGPDFNPQIALAAVRRDSARTEIRIHLSVDHAVVAQAS